MRKTFFLLVLCLTLTCQINAQKFKGGVQAGLLLTQVDGDDFSGYHKMGAFIGGFANIPFEEKKIQLQLEIDYAQKGSRAKMDYSMYKIRIHQIEMPFLFGWNFWKGFLLEIGPSFNFLVSAKEFNTLYGELETENRFHLFELGAVAGVGYRFQDHYGIGFRFNYSITSIGRMPVDRNGTTITHNMWNNALLFFAYYQF